MGRGPHIPFSLGVGDEGEPKLFAIESLPSASSNSIIPKTKPDAPIIGTATAGNAQATITWTEPISNGGSIITGYTITSNSGDSITVDGSTTTATISGLTNGTPYTFTVIATNIVGESLPSASSN